MAEFYVKKNKIEYELSNGKKLIDKYEKEKDSVLKNRLNQMEETINFEYKPYDFSFINFSYIGAAEYKNEIISFLKKYQKKNEIDQLTLGINKTSIYKDKWFIYGDNGKNNTVINEINFRPFCARIDYIKSKNKIYLQYMMEDKGKIIKEEFEYQTEPSSDDDILKEYLK